MTDQTSRLDLTFEGGKNPALLVNGAEVSGERIAPDVKINPVIAPGGVTAVTVTFMPTSLTVTDGAARAFRRIRGGDE